MQFGITFEKLLLIGLIAVLLIGPERLPRYAESVGKLARRAGEFLRDTKSRVRDEMGPEIDDVDWRKLDPRQYDPRRIIRDALFEDDGAAAPARTETVVAEPTVKPVHTPTVRPDFSLSSPPPYDREAT
ncbi:twin-arginine translocase TatA/TatE family subunit [Microbacterium sp. ISL-103]|jgi:sec-independent protein translocase protein TatB|uniref:twin-arginine translocase TatA/TatE family subunit n=1 Tax=Microbacterium sp. ISL-103 TaxID=2819156 RepID=UPI001BEA98EE|nr:twin-arginine translocase TatA/TatE family subunit [Microbacterium sp. ISL-103]MBT2475030.1 twin-arginine translocase TatA/TatE family subunit [Microbacterium sp. ISL-103]